MNATNRRRRTFQPDVDTLEGRVVPSATAAVAAAHAHAVEAKGQQELKHEGKVELQKEKLDLRITAASHTNANAMSITAGNSSKSPHMITAAGALPGAMSITIGTPIPTMSLGSAPSSSGTTSIGSGLQIHTLAPNDLDAPNAAMQGMSVGVAISESVGGGGPTFSGSSGTSTSGGSTGVVTGTGGSSSMDTTAGNTGTVTMDVPFTPISSVNNTGMDTMMM